MDEKQKVDIVSKTEIIKGKVTLSNTITVEGCEVNIERDPKELSHLFIQDPANGRNYFVTAKELKDNYEKDNSVLEKINPTTVVFAMPDGEKIPFYPDLLSEPSNAPAVMAWHVARNKVYVLTFKELQKHIIEGLPTEKQQEKAHLLLLPIKTDKIEELPTLMRGLLQHDHVIVYEAKKAFDKRQLK